MAFPKNPTTGGKLPPAGKPPAGKPPAGKPPAGKSRSGKGAAAGTLGGIGLGSVLDRLGSLFGDDEDDKQIQTEGVVRQTLLPQNDIYQNILVSPIVQINPIELSYKRSPDISNVTVSTTDALSTRISENAKKIDILANWAKGTDLQLELIQDSLNRNFGTLTAINETAIDARRDYLRQTRNNERRRDEKEIENRGVRSYVMGKMESLGNNVKSLGSTLLRAASLLAVPYLLSDTSEEDAEEGEMPLPDSRIKNAIETAISAKMAARAFRSNHSTEMKAAAANMKKRLAGFSEKAKALSTRLNKFISAIEAWGEMLKTTMISVRNVLVDRFSVPLKYLRFLANHAGKIYATLEFCQIMERSVIDFGNGKISEEEMHNKNKEQIKEIISVLGAPHLLSLMGAQMGTIVPFVGNTVGYIGGLVIGIFYGEEVLEKLGVLTIVDALYDWAFQDNTSPVRKLFNDATAYFKNKQGSETGRNDTSRSQRNLNRQTVNVSESEDLEGKTGRRGGSNIRSNVGVNLTQETKKDPIFRTNHPDTGQGYSIRGAGIDATLERPVVLEKDAAMAFYEMVKDSGGIVKGTDVTSSKRSKKKNASLPNAAQNSLHLQGIAIDIHGDSQDWIKEHGHKYGWYLHDYPGSGGWHFIYDKNRTNTDVPKIEESKDTEQRYFFNDKGEKFPGVTINYGDSKKNIPINSNIDSTIESTGPSYNTVDPFLQPAQ